MINSSRGDSKSDFARFFDSSLCHSSESLVLDTVWSFRRPDMTELLEACQPHPMGPIYRLNVFPSPVKVFISALWTCTGCDNVSAVSHAG